MCVVLQYVYCVVPDSWWIPSRVQGHTDEELPLQLNVLPPTLARMVAEKTRPAHETVGTVEQ